MLTLNVGSGPYKGTAEWVNVDIQEGADLQHDLRNPLPFPNGSVDTIIAVHLIEHFYQWELPKILDDWRRVLKVGGKLIMEFPDIKLCCDMYLNGATEDYRIRGFWGFWGNQEGNPDNEYQVHKYGYSKESLEELVKSHGFTNVEFTKAGIQHVEERDWRAICS